MSITHIPFYPSDWLAGTRGLSAEEAGVYINLVAKMYEMAGPIEEDHDRLHRICGTRSKAAFRRVLDYLVEEGKIIRTDDGLFNEKCAEVIEKVVGISSKARAAAEARWRKKPNKNKDSDDAGASLGHMRSDMLTKAKAKEEEEAKASSCAKPKPERFEEFWNSYPHRGGSKKGRKPSLAKYTAAVKRGVDEGDMIEGARRYASDRQVIDGYGKNPETWLNQEGWADEIEPRQFSAIPGGRNGQRNSNSKLEARLAGARAVASRER